jgi:hypothetical protein
MTEPITLNLTLKELQQIDKYVEINDDTLSVIMKITNAYPQQKSPVEIAYKDWWGEYPGTEIWTKDDEMRWVSFSAGYNASKEDNKVGEYQPTPQEPEELKTLYQMWNDGECRDDICYLVKIWMSQYADNVMCGEYKKGYEYCLTVLEENLK